MKSLVRYFLIVIVLNSTTSRGQIPTSDATASAPKLKQSALEERRAASEFQNLSGGHQFLAAPTNDLCSGAIVISESGPFPYLTQLIPDITDATTVGDPPLPLCQTSVSRSIWFRFTPAIGGSYTFSTCSNAPTGTTVDDNVIAIYRSANGCSGPFTQVPGACDDDGCAGSLKATVTATLGQDTAYYIVVWMYGVYPPPMNRTAVQLRVTHNVPPANDACSGAIPIMLNHSVSGTLAFAKNDYQLSGQTCFTGINQITSPSSGRDVVYSFTAPSTGLYSFRVYDYSTLVNLTLYVASSCPTASSSPVVVTSCLGASNRSQNGSAEEVFGLLLTENQTVYIYVDEHSLSAGTDFRLEVNPCVKETEPNNTSAAANTIVQGIEGATSPNGDVDFFSLGSPPTGSRVFALVDGAAASTTDFDLRVTTATDVLEYDDSDNDTRHGSLSPNVAGVPLTGAPSFLRISQYSPGDVSEPYRLYSIVQPPLGNAVNESEPNNTVSQANHAAANYFYGTLSGASPSQDVDIYGFMAMTGDLLFISVDGDPMRNNTPINSALALLNENGSVLMAVNDGRSVSSTIPGTGNLSANSPHSPGEAFVYRVTEDGLYFVRISISPNASGAAGAGDYLLSISKNGSVGGGGLPADIAVTLESPAFAATSFPMTYTMTVTNNGPVIATNVLLTGATPAGTTFTSFSTSQGSVTTPPVNGTGPISCQIGQLNPSATASLTFVVNVTAPPNSIITNTISASAEQPDLDISNNSRTVTTSVLSAVSELSVNVTTNPDSVLAGADYTYSITALNSGNTAATNTVIQDTLPTNMFFVSLTAPAGWIVSTPSVGSSGIVTMTRASFPVNTPAVFTLVTRANPFAPNGAMVSNCATITSDLPDPTPQNNRHCVSTRIVNVAPRIGLESSVILMKFGCWQSKQPRIINRRVRIDNLFAMLNTADMLWSATTTAPEITLTKASGRQGEYLTFTLNHTGLSTGSHTRTIVIQAMNAITNVPADNSPLTLTIRIDMEPFQNPGPWSQTRTVNAGWTQFVNTTGQVFAEVKSNSGPLSDFTVTVWPCMIWTQGMDRVRYVNRHYEFSTTALSPNVDIRLFYTENELDLMFISNPEDLRVWRQFPIGGIWHPTTSTSMIYNSCVEVTNVTAIPGKWVMAIPWFSSPLPLRSVDVVWAKAHQAELSWEMDISPGNKGVLIDRRQLGSETWATVGNVPPSRDNRYRFTDEVYDGIGYFYRLWTMDEAGNGYQSENILLQARGILSSEKIIENGLWLGQTFPNPINGWTSSTLTIQYGVSTGTHVRLTILDRIGREIANLNDSFVEPGSQTILWDIQKHPSGTYFIVLRAEGRTLVQRFTILR